MNRFALHSIFVVLVICSFEFLHGQEIVRQKGIKEDACCPCAIYNAIAFSDQKKQLDAIAGETPKAKVQSMIKWFASKPSFSYENRSRYADGHWGMTHVDTAASFNDVLNKLNIERKIQGIYLQRRDDEYLSGHLRRIHALFRESIESGQPVVTSFRSFVAKKKEGKDKPYWYRLSGHSVAVTHVQKELRPNEKGFSFEFVDSNSGKKEFGYMYFDQARNFGASRGNGKSYKWLRNRPYLCATVPSLTLKTNSAEFFERTFMAVCFGNFPEPVVALSEKRLYRTKVEMACGKCQFKLPGKDCKLAIRYAGKVGYVEGVDMDLHGDPKSKGGFCTTVRQSLVTGQWKGNTFHVENHELLPLSTKAAK